MSINTINLKAIIELINEELNEKPEIIIHSNKMSNKEVEKIKKLMDTLEVLNIEVKN